MLSNGGEDVDGQSVRLGHINGNEINPTLHEARDEMDVAGQSIKPGDDECGFVAAALVERGCELRTVGVPLAALNLLELGEQGSAVREPNNGGALGFQSEAALTLAVSRDAVVGDEGTLICACHQRIVDLQG
jgi:hypothetical protein